MLTRIAAAALVVATLAACTSGGGTAPAPTSTALSVTPSQGSTAPVSTGPTTVAVAAACPWVSTAYVFGHLGQRLGATTVLHSGGKVVGCRLYPLSHPNAQCDATCLNGEHLPGPKQPVLEILTYRYATGLAAHNAFVTAATSSSEKYTVTITASVPGITYRARFDPKDGATDWACGFSTATTRVLIRSDENNSADEITALARVVNRAL